MPCMFARLTIGRLLAILLGSLELSVEQCIEIYLRFSESVLNKEVAGDDEVDISDTSHASMYFNQITVERFIKQVLRERYISEERLLQAPSAISCKV